MRSKTGLYPAVIPALEATFNSGFVRDSRLLPAVILYSRCPCTLHWKCPCFQRILTLVRQMPVMRQTLSNGHSLGSVPVTKQV